MPDDVTIYTLTTVPLKGWNSSNIWEQPLEIKIMFREKLRAD